MRARRADEVPLRVCLELESNTLDPLFLVGNAAGFVAEKGEIKGKAHNENEEQAIGITRQDTHFPVASQARQSLRGTESVQAAVLRCRIRFPLTRRGGTCKRTNTQTGRYEVNNHVNIRGVILKSTCKS